jgi:hypothetical protein
MLPPLSTYTVISLKFVYFRLDPTLQKLQMPAGESDIELPEVLIIIVTYIDMKTTLVSSILYLIKIWTHETKITRKGVMRN